MFGQTSVVPGTRADANGPGAVTRVDDNVPLCALDAGTLAFVRALQSRVGLADAASQALAVQPDFSLSHALALLINRQALCRQP